MSNASFSEDEVVFELAELNGGWLDDFNRWNFPGDDKLLDFVEVIKRREREACAKVAEEMERIRFDSVGDPRIRVFESQIAKAIRARGEK